MGTITVQDGVSFPEAPDGYTLISLYRTDASLKTGTPDTTTWESHAINNIPYADAQTIRQQLANELWNQGQELLAFAMWETVDYNVTIPDQVCIDAFGELHCVVVPSMFCVPLTDYCYQIAGATLLQVGRYRFWICTQPIAVPSMLEVRGIGVGIAIVAAISILVGLFWIANVIWVQQGKMTPDQANTAIGKYSPGEQAKGVIAQVSLPLMALGFTMVATAIVLPYALSRTATAAGVSSTERVSVKPRTPLGEAEFSSEVRTGGR